MAQPLDRVSHHPRSSRLPSLENRVFTLLVALVFAWLLWPLGGAILWAVVLAIVFAPLQRYLTDRLQHRPGVAAFVRMLSIVFIVVAPTAPAGAALLGEAAGLYDTFMAGRLDFGLYFH